MSIFVGSHQTSVFFITVFGTIKTLCSQRSFSHWALIIHLGDTFWVKMLSLLYAVRSEWEEQMYVRERGKKLLRIPVVETH